MIETFLKVVFGVGIVVLLLATLVKLVFRWRRGPRAWLRPGLALVMVSAAAGLAAATPVGAGWDDGCNKHGARLPLIAGPQVWLGNPADVRLPYDEGATLVLRRGTSRDVD
jgi:hypothetical protein